MALTAAQFQQQLGEEIAKAFDGQYRFFKSRLELRRKSGSGDDVVILAGSNKYSPNISISFYFGRNFATAKQLEKRVGGHQFYYHIQQYSPRRDGMPGLEYSGPCSWSVDINSPPKSLVAEIVSAVHGMADPFFARFSTIESARDAIARNDPWCFGGKVFWRQLLLLDAAMDDLPHFQKWATRLGSFERAQAAPLVEQFSNVIRHVA